MISPAKILTYLDKIEFSFRSADDLARQAVLAQMPLIVVGGDGTAGSTQYGAGDAPFLLTMAGAASELAANADPDHVSAGIYGDFFAALDNYFALNAKALLISGKPVQTLDQYATYQNAAAIDSFLVGPNVARFYFIAKKSAPSALLSPGNVFAPVTLFGTAMVGSGGVVGFTPSASPNAIPTTNVASAQGYTPAAGLVAKVTTAIGGTLTVTVTGDGRDAGGNAVTGRTWTANLGSAAAGATVPFVPSVAGDRIASITSVTGSGAAGSGAFSLVSAIERVVS